ncbi:MAG TPA: helix-turn-helix transcriptional regulator [Paludibacteraceae bacterium]|nr:helix-turn-helix transcriptional regulator [Paludibacteraceae bacterium]HOU68611.1 helix-turn-helix transcriptional regulator [Paludibacteraceae bacterium]HQF50426.1 helix-turn-helix transcriptional regulator [Paludibacteraceae bacterium]HQJ89979.1 helix-turn-helix transcriptional regulator [Paludibacteraceae bacterium]
MKNRISQIIDKENLTSAKFAYYIGIQPSAVSHILSGRNNASTDVLQKILRAYPSINPEWLLLGIGDMYKKAPEPFVSQKVEVKTTSSQPQMLSLFGDDLDREPEIKQENALTQVSSSVSTPTIETRRVISDPISSQQQSSISNPPAVVQTRPTTDHVAPNETEQVSFSSQNQNPTQIQPASSPKRSISKIIVFYSDGTFEEIDKH